MMKVITDIIPGLPSQPFPKGKPTMIIAHEVANQTSTLQNESDYVNKNWQNAFFHELVDHTEARIKAPSTIYSWGAGPKANPLAYQIELVRDNGKNFAQAYQNYVNRLVTKAKEFGIPMNFNSSSNGIVTHHWVSDNLGGTDHTDPDDWLSKNGISLAQFESDLKKAYKGEDDMVLTKDEVNLIFLLQRNGPANTDEIKYWVGRSGNELLTAAYASNEEFRRGGVLYPSVLKENETLKQQISNQIVTKSTPDVIIDGEKFIPESK